MKNTILIYYCIFFASISCAQKIDSLDKSTLPKFEIGELQFILQETLDLNYVNYYYSAVKREKGLTIIVNDYIRPFYKNLKLNKFGVSVNFKSHERIYQELDENFVDFFTPFIKKGILYVSFGLRSKGYITMARFKLRDGKWIMLTKSLSNEKKPKAIVDFKNDKEQCLAYKILTKKYSEKKQFERYAGEKCKKFNF